MSASHSSVSCISSPSSSIHGRRPISLHASSVPSHFVGASSLVRAFQPWNVRLLTAPPSPSFEPLVYIVAVVGRPWRAHVYDARS